MQVNVGDFVDVRCVAVAISDHAITALARALLILLLVAILLRRQPTRLASHADNSPI